eukprot:9027277-Pyramimonas_sp.AAC.1
MARNTETDSETSGAFACRMPRSEIETVGFLFNSSSRAAIGLIRTENNVEQSGALNSICFELCESIRIVRIILSVFRGNVKIKMAAAKINLSRNWLQKAKELIKVDSRTGSQSVRAD